MAITPSYTVVNTASIGQAPIALLLGLADEAFRLWGLQLAGNASASVRIEITTAASNGRADGGWGNGQGLGTVNGFSLAIGGPAYELMTGLTAAGNGFDVNLRFDPTYLLNELYLDPTPQTRTDTPIDRTDGMSVMLHEIGHALGFTGYFEEATTTFSGNFNTPYDQRLIQSNGETFFRGPNSTALLGGDVSLTNNNYTHYGNSFAFPGTSNDPLTGLMNGVVFYRGYRYEIGQLDLAMLADTGLGTSRDDILDAPGHVYFRGGNGNDTITGSALDNRLFGDDGNDMLMGMGGIDRLTGGNGNDIADGGDGNDVVSGNDGDDDLRGGADNDTLVGGNGNDRMAGGSGLNELIGGIGNDVYVVTTRTDSTFELAGEGIDTVETTFSIYGLQANVENLTYLDNLPHGAGVGNALDNVIAGGTGTDDLFGRDGNDTLRGGSGAANTLFGQQGDDIYIIEAAGDSVIENAGEGNDTVQTARASFTLRTNVENLTYTGTATFTGIGSIDGNTITGGNGADFLSGLDGNDILIGGPGADQLLGGTGSDQFRYATAAGGTDRIIDFAVGIDKIMLAIAGFGAAAGMNFVSGPNPQFSQSSVNANGRTILFDTNNGIISFDADGYLPQAPVAFAQVNLGTVLTFSDFGFY